MTSFKKMLMVGLFLLFGCLIAQPDVAEAGRFRPVRRGAVALGRGVAFVVSPRFRRNVRAQRQNARNVRRAQQGRCR